MTPTRSRSTRGVVPRKSTPALPWTRPYKPWKPCIRGRQLNVQLSNDEINYLEEPYVPQAAVGLD